MREESQSMNYDQSKQRRLHTEPFLFVWMVLSIVAPFPKKARTSRLLPSRIELQPEALHKHTRKVIIYLDDFNQVSTRNNHTHLLGFAMLKAGLFLTLQRWACKEKAWPSFRKTKEDWINISINKDIELALFNIILLTIPFNLIQLKYK